MTRTTRGDRLTIEKLARDCLDARFLRRHGFLEGSWVTIGPSFRWPRIARLRIARYLIILDLQGRTDPQLIRVSWTRVHLGGERRWPAKASLFACKRDDGRAERRWRGSGGTPSRVD